MDRAVFRSSGWLLFLVLLACWLAVLNPANAQVDSGQLSGTVSDSSGAVIAGAAVTARSLSTNLARFQTTSNQGEYVFTGLPADIYEVSAKAPNFQQYSEKIQITVGGRLKFDPKLSVSSGTTEVEVLGEGGAQVNTQSQELSQVVSRQEVMQLPSLTRNPYDFVAIAGNISSGDRSAQGKNQNATVRGVGFNVNGQRSAGTEILLDGVENTDLYAASVGITVPIDSVQEYRILTSNFDPQYGRASGGIVNVVTKAGSNAFHGGAWEFNRLAAYTSNTVTNVQSGLSKGGYTRNQFGYAVGGPVRKDKLFFFQSLEWLRVRSSSSQISVVPTPQLLNAAASNVQSFFQTYGNRSFKFLRTYTAQNMLDEGDGINANGALVKALGLNTPAFGAAAYQAPTDSGGGYPQNNWNLVARADWNPTERTQAYLRYVQYRLEQQGSGFISPYAEYDVGETDGDYAVLGNVSHVFGSSLLINTKLSFSRLNSKLDYAKSLEKTPTLLVGIRATLGGNYIQLPGFYDLNPIGGGLPYGGPQNTIQWNQDLNWTRGTHSMQYGAQFLYIQNNRAYGAYGQAVEQLGQDIPTGLDNLITGNLYSFQAAVDPKGALPCVNTSAPTSSCLVSLPASSPNFARSNRFHDWAIYAQDAWRITSRLTLDYGLRYEYYGVQHNNHPNLDSNFYYSQDSGYFTSIRNGQVFTAPQSPMKGLWEPRYGTVSPRIGFAYDVFGDSRTSLRAGYGVSYERNFGRITFNVIQNPPAYGVIQVFNTQVTTANFGPLGGTSGQVPLPHTSLRNVDEHIQTAQAQFWSAAVEHELLRNTVASMEYGGARGTHLYDIRDINGVGLGNLFLGDSVNASPANPCRSNQWQQNPGTYSAFCKLTRLNGQYTGINNRGSNGDSYYEALNLHFQTTNIARTGFSAVANYTLAHSIDDLSTAFSESNNTVNTGYTQPFNPGYDRGNSDSDVRHRFVIAPIYALSWSKKDHPVASRVLGNWQFSGIYTVRSGSAFNYFDGSNYAGYGATQRYAPSTPLRQHSFRKAIGNRGGNFYTVASNLPASTPAANPALGGISDWGPYLPNAVARNSFYGPGAWNLDLAVTKQISVSDGVNLEFRAEGFDLLNHHNLYVLETQNNQTNFLDASGNPLPISIYARKGGVNGGANDERRFGQFALRVNF